MTEQESHATLLMELQRLHEALAHAEEERDEALQAVRDMQRRIEEQHHRFQELAYHDPLTGLPNGVLLEETVSDYVSLLAPLWLFRIKLHRMDRIRDTMGHHIGDEFFRRMAKRLRRAAAGSLMLARTDRDTFAVVTTPEQTPDPQAFAERIILSFSHSCTIGSWSHRPETHVGYAAFPEDAVAWSLLEKKVGTALVVSGRAGSSCAMRWAVQMDEAVQQALRMELNLQRAVQRGEIMPVYQPIVDATTGGVRGFEALMRWDSPDHGHVSPERFIPILEETGLIVPFGEWMLQTCCRQNVAWQRLTGVPTIMSVNVSTVQFRRGRFPDTVRRVLAETGMPAETLEIEVTESVLLDDLDGTLEDLEALRTLGCRISMDDFGTGYSSLSYLRKLPLHTLKIDKSFVDDLIPETGADASRLIGSIVALAHDLHLEVVAEGVETTSQQQQLFDSRCDLLQGFVIHKPMRADEVGALLFGQTEKAFGSEKPQELR
jgi:diguanylate cyclase (GGDEF)-like protein